MPRRHRPFTGSESTIFYIDLRRSMVANHRVSRQYQIHRCHPGMLSGDRLVSSLGHVRDVGTPTPAVRASILDSLEKSFTIHKLMIHAYRCAPSSKVLVESPRLVSDRRCRGDQPQSPASPSTTLMLPRIFAINNLTRS